MARGRNSEKIKRITRNDGETMKSIAHTGVITRSNAKEYFNLNDKRIELLKKNNYLIEHTNNTKQGLQTYYTLGNAGVNFIKSKTDIDYLYRGNKNQIDHDIKLNQAYCQISHEQRQGWLNENQIIHRCLINKCLHVVERSFPAGKNQWVASWNMRSSNLALKGSQISDRWRWRGQIGLRTWLL